MAAPSIKKWNASELPAFPDCRLSEKTLSVSIPVTTFAPESGPEQRISFITWVPRIWFLINTGMDLTTRDILEAFWRDRVGSLKPFKWTSAVTGDLYYVRFNQPSFEPEHIGPDVYTWTFQIKEAHPLEIDLEA